MQLINKQNNLPVALFYLFQHSLQPFLKFTPVLGSRHQGSHVQGKELLILQSVRDIPPHDSLGQTFHHGCLAHAGLTDKHRVVLRLTGEDTDNITNLAVTADNRVQLLVPGPLHQVISIFG